MEMGQNVLDFLLATIPSEVLPSFETPLFFGVFRLPCSHRRLRQSKDAHDAVHWYACLLYGQGP